MSDDGDERVFHPVELISITLVTLLLWTILALLILGLMGKVTWFHGGDDGGSITGSHLPAARPSQLIPAFIASCLFTTVFSYGTVRAWRRWLKNRRASAKQ